MTDGREIGAHKPQFVLEPSMGERTIETLRKLEDIIFAHPDEVAEALRLQAEAEAADHSGGIEPAIGVSEDPEEFNVRQAVKLATSREAGLDFDDPTEAAITASGTMKAVQDRRRTNESNPVAAQRGAAEVRRTRLELFLSMATRYNEETKAEVVPLPPPRNDVRRTRTRSRSA